MWWLYRDRGLTLVQNYKRLGLASRLGAPTGGTEKTNLHNITGAANGAPRGDADGLAIPGSRKAAKLVPTEVRVERDPQTGRILRVIRPDAGSDGGNTRRKRRRLDDPLNSDSEPENGYATIRAASMKARSRPPPTGVVAELEAQAEEEAAQLSRKKRPRQQSKREEEWIEGLVGKYGDNVGAMAKDRRLNPMQQTEADIARRVGRWRGRRENAWAVEAAVA